MGVIILNVILFSTGCPKCKVLKKKLDDKDIEYTIDSNVDKMLEMGIMEVPVLVVDDRTLDFSNAVAWVNSL